LSKYGHLTNGKIDQSLLIALNKLRKSHQLPQLTPHEFAANYGPDTQYDWFPIAIVEADLDDDKSMKKVAEAVEAINRVKEVLRRYHDQGV
jgi:hypothetical protein